MDRDLLEGVNLLQRPFQFFNPFGAARLWFADHDDDDTGTGDGANSGSGSGDGSEPDSDDDEGDDDDDEEDPDPKKGDFRIHKLSREAAKYRTQAKLARDQLDAVQAKLREFEDKDKSEIEKLQRDLAEAIEAKNAADKRLKDRAIENAFLTANTVTWHNPSRAMRLIDLSEVDIDDDGNVTGMDKAIKALVKSDPYLVKNGDKGGTQPPSGAGGKGKPPSGAAPAVDKDALAKKYPAAVAGR